MKNNSNMKMCNMNNAGLIIGVLVLVTYWWYCHSSKKVEPFE